MSLTIAEPDHVRTARKAGLEGGSTAGRRSPRLGNSTFGRGRIRPRQALCRSSLRHPEGPRGRHRNRAFRAAPIAGHIAYLERDGVTRDGEKAHMFSATEDRVRHHPFARCSHDDRHHFCFVAAPEDAAEMTDLKAFTRDLVAQMERDLGTRLDWIAVDHWNTDNSHAHLARST
jgi:hypothetical protein